MDGRESEALRRILVLDQRYEVNDCFGQEGEGCNFEVYEGNVPVLVSAPHAVKQLREGRIKRQDGLTGGIVEYLIEEYGLYGITRLWSVEDDPNFADDERSVAYRDKVAEIVDEVGIKWTFDIHACRDAYGFDMDVGINGGGNLACDREEVERMVDFWREEGLDVRIDAKFKAAWSNTVSNYVHRKTGVNCVQLELAEGVRRGDEKMEKFLRGFEKVLELLGSGGEKHTNGYSGR